MDTINITQDEFREYTELKQHQKCIKLVELLRGPDNVLISVHVSWPNNDEVMAALLSSLSKVSRSNTLLIEQNRQLQEFKDADWFERMLLSYMNKL